MAKKPTKEEDEDKDDKIDQTSEDLEMVPLNVAALVEAHPVGTVAAALGIGYVLGGGLFTSLTSRLLRWGFRLGVQFAVLPALEREVIGLAGDFGKPAKGSKDGAGQARAHQ